MIVNAECQPTTHKKTRGTLVRWRPQEATIGVSNLSHRYKAEVHVAKQLDCGSTEWPEMARELGVRTIPEESGLPSAVATQPMQPLPATHTVPGGVSCNWGSLRRAGGATRGGFGPESFEWTGNLAAAESQALQQSAGPPAALRPFGKDCERSPPEMSVPTHKQRCHRLGHPAHHQCYRLATRAWNGYPCRGAGACRSTPRARPAGRGCLEQR